MDPIFTPLLAGLARHALTSIGGFLVASGVMQSNQTNDFVGACMVLLGIAWSYWNKKGQAQMSGLLKKLTATSNHTDAVDTAKAMPPADKAVVAKAIVTGARVASLVLFAFAVSLFLAVGSPAHAQTKRGLQVTGNPVEDIKADLGLSKPTPGAAQLTGNVEKDMMAIWQKIISASTADLTYASALAGAAGSAASKTRKQCWDAIIAINQQANGATLKNPDGTPMTRPDPHLFTDVETLAEVIDNLSPQGTLFTSCAGAAQLAKSNTLTFINAVVTGAAGIAALPAGL